MAASACRGACVVGGRGFGGAEARPPRCSCSDSCLEPEPSLAMLPTGRPRRRGVRRHHPAAGPAGQATRLRGLRGSPSTGFSRCPRSTSKVDRGFDDRGSAPRAVSSASPVPLLATAGDTGRRNLFRPACRLELARPAVSVVDEIARWSGRVQRARAIRSLAQSGRSEAGCSSGVTPRACGCFQNMVLALPWRSGPVRPKSTSCSTAAAGARRSTSSR